MFEKRKKSFSTYMFAGVIAISPAAGLWSKEVNNIFFWILILSGFCIALSGKNRYNKNFLQFLWEYWPFWLAMATMSFSALVNGMFGGDFQASSMSVPLRFLAVPFIVYGALYLSSTELCLVQWGFAFAIVLNGIWMMILSEMGAIRPVVHSVGFSLIPFTNLVCIIGALACMTTNWEKTPNKMVQTGKILVFLIFTVSSAYLSENRQSWIILLVLAVIVIGMFLIKNKRNVLRRLIVITTIFLVFLGILYQSPKVQKRIINVQKDISLFKDGTNKDTSIGLRLQFYEAGWMIFKAHPWFGIGNKREQFKEAMTKQIGIISPVAADGKHLHNELLQNMVKYGFFGFFSYMAISCIPFIYFFRHVRSHDDMLKTVAYMGVVFNFGIFLSGLTDLIFEQRHAVQFYVIIQSILFTLLIRRRSELNNNLSAI